MSKKLTPKQLQAIYDKHGGSSKEFHFAVEGLVFYVLNRHFKGYNLNSDNDSSINSDRDDIVQECFIKLDWSLKNHFNPQKGNIVTFTYTTVRNIISILRTQKQKRTSLDFDADIEAHLENKEQDDSYGKIDSEALEELLLNEIPLLKIADDFKEKLKSNDIKYLPLTKVVLWSKIMNSQS